LPVILAISTASVGFEYWDHWKGFGSVAFLNAPDGFGVANFLLELSATILVASLSWKYVPKVIRGIGGSPAR
jgi:hypothetical protein